MTERQALPEDESENVIDLHPGLPAPRPREIAPEDWTRYADHVGEIFEALGMDLDTPGTRDTPERFLEAMYAATAGYDGDPKLSTTFPAESRGDTEEAELAQIIEGPDRSMRCASITRCRSTGSRTSATWPTSASSGSRS